MNQGRCWPTLFRLAKRNTSALEPIFAEEDLQRQEQANEKRYTTAQVLAHLDKL